MKHLSQILNEARMIYESYGTSDAKFYLEFELEANGFDTTGIDELIEDIKEWTKQ